MLSQWLGSSLTLPRQLAARGSCAGARGAGGVARWRLAAGGTSRCLGSAAAGLCAGGKVRCTRRRCNHCNSLTAPPHTHLTRTLTQGISIDSLMRPGLTAASALPSSACALVRILVRTWHGASKHSLHVVPQTFWEGKEITSHC